MSEISESSVSSKIFNPHGIEKAASEVAGVLRAVANERRLLILCKLVERGEANVNSLAEIRSGFLSPLSLSIWRKCARRDW